LEMHFEGENVTVFASDRIYGNSITLHGRMQNP
jgi:hypothetical protein